MTSCPLCGLAEGSFFAKDEAREYFRCPACALIFTPPAYFLSPEDEKRRYDLHENSSDDPGYRNFLSRLFVPLAALLKPMSRGLDFGAGPGPALARMLEEAGHTVDLYDPFYADRPQVFERRYSFITATEVFEHLRCPGPDLDRLWNCLEEGGVLGVMTKLAPDRNRFAEWHYRNDRTHVCFYSEETFRWLAQKWGAAVTFQGEDVILIRK